MANWTKAETATFPVAAEEKRTRITENPILDELEGLPSENFFAPALGCMVAAAIMTFVYVVGAVAVFIVTRLS